MKIVWEQDEAPAADIIDRIAEKKSWNHRTVKTLISRLVKKRALSYREVGNRYQYQAGIEKEEAIQGETRSFIGRVFDGQALPMLTHFINATEMSGLEISELRQLLEEKEKSDKKSLTRKRKTRRAKAE